MTIRRRHRKRASCTCTENGGLGDLEYWQAVVDAWKGMGTRCLSYPPMPPILALVFLFILGICVNSVHSCDLNECWNTYRDARAAEQAGLLLDLVKDENPVCVVYRTYLNCLTRKERSGTGCKTSLRFQSIKFGYRNKMKHKKCDNNGTVYEKEDGHIITNPVDDDYMCSFTGERKYKHCGLFGDPHLRTFTDEFQTCKVEGAWALINNRHLTVQVTNDPVVENGAATATSKLTVVIKKNEDCAATRYVTYAAQTDSLPGTFDDGRKEYGPENSVKLYELEPGKHIKIYLRYIDTTIVVRQIGRYFTFSVKMPEEVIASGRRDDDLELCVQGCPIQERINYQKYLAERQKDDGNMPRSDAVDLCKQAKVVDFYFDSCVFDLMTTGDREFTVSAYRAWQDLIELSPSITQSQSNRTDLTQYDNTYSGSSSPCRTTQFDSVRLIVLTILICLWHHYRPV